MAEVFIGTYTETIHFASGKVLEGKGEGVYRFHMDDATGALTLRDIIEGAPNPSFVVWRAAQNRLYAVNECKTFLGRSGGALSVYAPAGGTLRLVKSVPSNGVDPCHVAVSPEGSMAIASNYGSGSFALYPLDENGLPGSCALLERTGCGPHPTRQTGPHAHFSLFYGETGVLLANLGTDSLLQYDRENARLAYRGAWQTKGGDGPRNLALSPDGAYLYVVNELACSVSAYRMGARGVAALTDSLPLAPNAEAGSTAADIHVTPNGKYVYATLRGANLIIGFAAEAGRLRRLGAVSSGGDVPRSFALHPNGRFLLAANQNSDNLVCFSIAPDGTLEQCGETKVNTPVCVSLYA